MRLKRIILSTVVVASAGALTAVTIPALAGTDPDPTEEPDRVAADLLGAMQRDLDLTAEQAAARLDTGRWAGQTTAALRGALGEDRYAGAWLTEDASALMVAVTDQAAAEQVRAAGAEPRLVDRAAGYLDGVKAALDAHAGQAGDPVAGWYVDPASNAVVVLAPDWAESSARTFAAISGVADEAVRVVASDEQPRPLIDVLGGDPYFIDDAARCSVGFSVQGGFVTAGHCALAGTTTTGFDGSPQGEFVAASFPGVGENGPDDWGVVAVNDDWVPQPLVNDFEGGVLPVAGAEEAPVGASVCKFGSTTGASCGTVQALDATVNYPEGTVTGLTRTDACAEPGDSGGAWLADDQAQGVTSGGSGDCTVGGITFFQPLDEILEVNDLTLVTTTDE
jgi:streptogrisin C